MYDSLKAVLRLSWRLQPLKRGQSHLGSNDGSTWMRAWSDSEMRLFFFDWPKALFFNTQRALFQLHRQEIQFTD